jgi:2-methylcitrate dehydratase PrpD
MVGDTYTRALSEFASAACYEQLPQSTVHATRRLIMDTLGCAVAGFDTPSSQIIQRVIGKFGGAPDATCLVSGRRLPAPLAAYINSHMSNALDADDDFHYKAHIAAAVVTPALAMAQREGSSGAELVNAVALGYDIAARIGLSLKGLIVTDGGAVEYAPLTGYSWCGFASAIASAKLLELNPVQTAHALGLAAVTIPMPASSTFSLEPRRPMTKYGMYGTMSEAGTTAALLAQAGMTAPLSILDGDKGLWRMVGSLGSDNSKLVENLGRRWMIEEASYKIYPACRFTNAASDLYLSLQRRHGFLPCDIERVEIGLIGPALAKQIGDPTVETMIDGCFSMPYILAVTALGGPPGPGWHTEDMRRRPDIRALAAKVFVKLEDSAAAKMAEDIRRDGHASRLPASIRIWAGGREFAAAKDYAHGDVYTTETILKDEELEAKFRAFCKDILAADQLDAALERLWSLDSQSSVTDLVSSLVAREPGAPGPGRNSG